MSDAILTGVTFDRDAWGDPRFDYLAQLCGLADADHARGKMGRLWSVCTALKTNTPPLSRIVVCLGPRGPEALIDADLGERTADGLVRVKGCERHDWYVKQQHEAGGRARASAAARDPKTGRLLPSGGPATHQRSTSDHQQPPAQDQDLDQRPSPVHEPVSPDLGADPPAAVAPSTITREASDSTNARGEPLPLGWGPDDTPETREAEQRAVASGVVVAHALRKFRDKARGGGWRSHDWAASYRAFLGSEWVTSPQIVEALTRAQRKTVSRAARDRERDELARIQENARRAAEDIESVQRTAKTAHASNFQQLPEKATG